MICTAFAGVMLVACSDTSDSSHVMAQTRILHPAGPNADGSYTYAFFMDPRISGADYDIRSLLKRAYPAAEAERHMATFTAALAREGAQHLLVQSPD